MQLRFFVNLDIFYLFINKHTSSYSFSAYDAEVAGLYYGVHSSISGFKVSLFRLLHNGHILV